MYTVYSLRTPDGRIYVGATSMTVRERWNNGNGYRFLPEMWYQIQTYGWDSVEKVIHATALTREEASLLEKELISKYDSTNPLCGFNRELGGIATEKAISKVSRKKHSDSTMGMRNHNYGTHFSKEHRMQIAYSNRGQKRSPETCRNIGKSKEKPVEQFTIDGELVGRWDSGRKASIATGIDSTRISKVCKGQRKTAGGFVWRFAQ